MAFLCDHIIHIYIYMIYTHTHGLCGYVLLKRPKVLAILSSSFGSHQADLLKSDVALPPTVVMMRVWDALDGAQSFSVPGEELIGKTSTTLRISQIV